ncbi:right-handed parallel beta-helix repeat-containing protein [bacterium]|nr:right-handed parallel beta-helix repeat-containing protein [bacterium]
MIVVSEGERETMRGRWLRAGSGPQVRAGNTIRLPGIRARQGSAARGGVRYTLLIALLLTFSHTFPSEASYDLYISPAGSDQNPGTINQPLQTLEAARYAIRIYKQTYDLPADGVNVWLRGGHYERQWPFTLESQDSGSPTSYISYRAYPGETPKIVGGVVVPTHLFTTVASSSPNWWRIDSLARGNLMQVDLVQLGLVSYGEMVPRGYISTGISPLEVFFKDLPMQLARWPNEGFAYTTGAPLGQNGQAFSYSGDRPNRWYYAKDPWVFGYWYYLWADDYVPLQYVDQDLPQIYLDKNPSYGVGTGAPWYALNLLEELDTPGEWYLDRQDGILYFWPPSPLSEGTVLLSVIDSELMRLNNASYLRFKGITFEVSRAKLINIQGATSNIIQDCVLRNAGTEGVYISGGTWHKVERSEISYTGEEAVWINAGDRATLNPSSHRVLNCDIHHFGRWCRTNRPAVRLYGSGGVVSHNEIHDAPHVAIKYEGNNHVIEYNHIHHVCEETGDAGALYSGRDWGSFGNVIRYNFIHDINSALSDEVHAIYLDDCDSGDTILGNIIYEVDHTGILIGGGRSNVVDNNIIVGCKYAISLDARGVDRITLTAGDNWNLLDKIQRYNYTQPPWSAAYPALAAILDEGYEEAKKPKNNILTHNVFNDVQIMLYLGSQGGISYSEYMSLINIETSLARMDPQFIDEANLNLQIQDTSPAYGIPGFQRIPFEQIGIIDFGDPPPPPPLVVTRTGATWSLYE